MEEALLGWLAKAIDSVGRNAGSVIMLLAPAWAIRRLYQSALGASLRDRLRRPTPSAACEALTESVRSRIERLEQRALELRRTR